MELANLKKMSASALFHFSLLLLAFPILAAPTKGAAADPVAANYPVWTGVTPKNYIAGRQLVGGSDLRQRVTIVVVFDAAKAAEQLEATGILQTHIGFSPVNVTFEGVCWETFVMPHNPIVAYSARNCKSTENVAAAMSLKGKKQTDHPGLAHFSTYRGPVYRDLAFEGAPDDGGKLPFVYVMGVEGKEPVFKGEYKGKETVQAVQKACQAEMSKLKKAEMEWRPFYGFVAEPKHFGKDIEKALKTGKPTLEAVEAKLLKNVSSSDAETAKEAQMLYDALEQTKSDYMYVAAVCVASAPHVAAYKVNAVTRLWPKTKKALADIAAKVKANDGASALVKIYPKIVEWSDPAYVCKNAGEAKKNVAELNKMKKMIAPLKDDKNITVQNGALLLDNMLDELISLMPSKVAQK